MRVLLSSGVRLTHAGDPQCQSKSKGTVVMAQATRTKPVVIAAAALAALAAVIGFLAFRGGSGTATTTAGAAPSTTAAGNGGGLGLSIVAQIAEGHGATVTLLPRPGGGIVARFALPED
jgi:nitrogen-specific signal transduction histidine kinase